MHFGIRIDTLIQATLESHAEGLGDGGKKHFIFFFFTSESGMLNCINTELESKWVCGTHALK